MNDRSLRIGPAPRGLRGARILFINEVESRGAAVRIPLERAGCEFLEAGSVAEGLVKAREDPDVIVLYAKLPEQPGSNFWRELKRDPVTATIPVLRISAASAGPEDEADGLAEGGDAWLVEPFESAELVAQVGLLVRLKRTQVELRATRERLLLAVEGSSGAQWEIPVDSAQTQGLTDAMVISPRLKGFIGFEDEEFPSSVSAWQERIHPEDYPRVMAAAQAHREGRAEAHEVDYRIRHRDGSWRWISSTGRLFKDAKGVPRYWAGVDWDISARKQVEESLRTSREQLEWDQDRLRFVLNATGVGLWLNELPLSKLNWDARTRELFFVPEGTEPTIELFWSRLHPEDR